MDDAGYARAQECGNLWLNGTFVVRAERSRLWRTQIRLSIVDVIFVTIFLLVFGLVAFFGSRALLVVPGMDRLVNPYVMAVILAPAPAWFLGRRVSHVSPYRRRTGEGIGAYLYVKADSKSFLLGRVIGRRVAVNRCETRVSGKREVVSCVEWVGTARAPLMPRYDPDSVARGAKVPAMDVRLVPRSVPVNYLDRQRDDNRRATAGLKLETSW